jgi:hypothetical protein
MEKERGEGQRKTCFFLELLILFLNKTVSRNPKARKANKENMKYWISFNHLLLSNFPV